MSMDSIPADGARLRVEGEMTIQRAAELKPVLLQTLAAAGDEIALDLSGVTDIDSAGVQLLFMLSDAAAARQRSLRLRQPSPAVQHVFELLGLEGSFAVDALAVSTAFQETA